MMQGRFLSPEPCGNPYLSCDLHVLSLPLVDRRAASSDEIGREGNLPSGYAFRKLSAQSVLIHLPPKPRVVEILEFLPFEPAARFGQELEVRGDRNDIFVAFPLSSHIEIAENLGGNILLKRLLYKRPETLFSPQKRRGPRCNVDEPES